MTITFNKADRDKVIVMLKEADAAISEERINDVMYDAEDALLQQFDEEVEFLITDYEANHRF